MRQEVYIVRRYNSSEMTCLDQVGDRQTHVNTSMAGSSTSAIQFCGEASVLGLASLEPLTATLSEHIP
jgi:hypothetical protein